MLMALFRLRSGLRLSSPPLALAARSAAGEAVPSQGRRNARLFAGSAPTTVPAPERLLALAAATSALLPGYGLTHLAALRSWPAKSSPSPGPEPRCT